MGVLTKIKSVSYPKANAAEMLRTIAEDGAPVVITQNGEARAVLQDVAGYERTQETLALPKLTAMGEREVAERWVVPAREGIAAVRAQLSERYTVDLTTAARSKLPNGCWTRSSSGSKRLSGFPCAAARCPNSPRWASPTIARCRSRRIS